MTESPTLEASSASVREVTGTSKEMLTSPFTKPKEASANVELIFVIFLTAALGGIVVTISTLTLLFLLRKKFKGSTHSAPAFGISKSLFPVTLGDSIVNLDVSTEVMTRIETVQTRRPMNVSNGKLEEQKNKQMVFFDSSPDGSLRLVERNNHLESNSYSCLVNQEINRIGSNSSLCSNVGRTSIVSSHEDGSHFNFTTYCSTECNV